MISSEDNWAQQGEFVDFRDKDNNPWQVGYVLSRTKNIIKIRTEGWSSKFDEVIVFPLSFYSFPPLQGLNHFVLT
jgi:hypothetical protein